MSRDDSNANRLGQKSVFGKLISTTTSDVSAPGQISVSSKAATNYANVTRAQYDDWLERFYPRQKELMDSTQTGALLKEQLARVDDNFDSANEAAQVANSNQLARYGLAASQDSTAQAKSSLANVTSKNSLRENEKERALSVLSGSGKSNLSQLEVS
ncbi:hypothetical protein [Vibrio sp. YQ_11]|uniref:hypothetical protein n=1 Tax=unclassified Vibrio TaxID=2614977 RepID=UPI00370BB62D